MQCCPSVPSRAGRGQSSPRDCALPSPTQRRPIQVLRMHERICQQLIRARRRRTAGTAAGEQDLILPKLTGCSSAKFGEGNVLSIPNCSAVRTRHKAERAGAKPSSSAELAASEMSTRASPSSSSGGHQHEAGTVTPPSRDTQPALSLLVT